MAFRRTRRTLRRRPRRTRRAAIRRTRPMRMQLTRLPNVYKFSRYSFYQAPLTAFTTDANGQYFGVIFAQGINSIYTDNAVLSMPGVSEFTNLFDQYKILQYSVEFIPRYNSREMFSSGTAQQPWLPTIYWVPDQDDVSVPTSAGSIMEHPKVRYRVMDKPVKITVRYPCIADSIYSSSVVTGYATRKAPFIDCNSASVQHYGVKYMVQGAATQDYKQFFDMRAHWSFLCKNPR